MSSFRDFIRSAFHLVLIASVFFSTFPASADRKIASIRVAAPVKSHQKNHFQFTAADQIALNRAFLDYLVRTYNHAKTFEDFKDEFSLASRMSANDLNEMKREFAANTRKPALHRENDSLIFEDGGQKLVIEWPEPLKLRVKINGMVWTFNRHEPVRYQVELALKKLEMSTGRSALFDFLFPQSHAENLVEAAAVDAVKPAAGAIKKVLGELWRTAFVKFFLVTGVGGAVAIGLSGTFSTLGCALIVADNVAETKWGLCYQWRKDLDEATARRKDRMGKVDGLEKSKTEAEKKEDFKYLPDADNMCLALRDKTKSNYVVDFRAMKRSGADTFVPDGDWFSVVQYYHPDGSPDKFVVTPKGTETSDPQWMDKAKAVLNFDAGHLSTISYPNPAYQMNDPTSQTFLKQDIATDEAVLTSDQRTRRDTMVSLTNSINTWTHVCGEINFVKDLQGHNVKVDNPNPSPQVTTPIKDVPAAQTTESSSIISHISK